MSIKGVYFIDGKRTPFIKARGPHNPFSASDLAVHAGRALLLGNQIDPTTIDEVIIGSVMPAANEANIGRIIALRLGCGFSVPAWTVMRNCASAMQALDSAAKDIQLGRSQLVLAGGTEAMSRAPVLASAELVAWLAQLNSARSPMAKLKALAALRPAMLRPEFALLQGLADPIVELNMGQTCEIIAHRFGISRAAMDEYSVRSHLRLAKAYEQGWMGEVEPLFDPAGKVIERDDGLRPDSSVEKLGKLKPAFDRRVGMVTAGNSSQITDGAAVLLMAGERWVERHRPRVLGRLVDVHWAALDPAKMGLGPVHATTPILTRNNLALDDIDCWEINEAFAGQVLACVAAWADDDYCREELGLPGALGTIDQDRLNVDGGAVAIGHPVGASGSRIVLHALEVLRRTGGRRAIATLCIGGGQGGSMLVERVTDADAEGEHDDADG